MNKEKSHECNCKRILIAHIRNDSKASFSSGAIDLFEKCIPADYLYANAWGKSGHCIINRASLWFDGIPVDKIVSIRISHHWSYDELYVKLTDVSERIITLENKKTKLATTDASARMRFAN